MTEHIYGIDYTIPAQPKLKDIAGYGLPEKQQKFRRTEIPAIFDDLEFDADDNPIYSPAQISFINQELDRAEYGYWFFNKGIATYITGLHYFYLNYWTLDTELKPDYRNCDRRFFYFQDYCEKKPYIDGIIRGKKRREGATSQAAASMMKDALSISKAFCGIVSKTGADADDVFNKMVMPAYHALPVFLKPRCEDPESKTSLVFNRKKEKNKKTEKKKGQIFEASKGIGSIIEWRTTKLNSFDSGRKTKMLVDEGGKFPADVPINEYWPIIQQTLKIGGVRVGFALLPSTSNKLTKGGRGYKLLWDESNQFEHKITPSGLYRYFSPAEEGLEPFIDEYGFSITEPPTEEQKEWMKRKYNEIVSDEMLELGAKKWLDAQLNKIKNAAPRNEHKRMYPRSERDLFDFDDGTNIYDLEAVRAQKDYLNSKPPTIRSVRFYRRHDDKADFVDDPNGMWKILMLPDDNEKWATTEVKGKVAPGNAAKYSLTADPFKNTIVVGKGSNAGAFIWKKFNPMDPENSGLPIAMFWGRPKLKRLFHEQMLLAAEYYGAELCYESDYDDYIEFLMGEKKMGYAKERPKNTIDPNRKTVKKSVKEYGVKSGDGFSYNMMLTRSVEYVILHCNKIYFMELLDQLEEYDETERTWFDLAVAFQLGTVVISDPVKPKLKEALKVQVVKTYDLTKK